MSEQNEQRHHEKVIGSKKPVIPKSVAIESIRGFRAIYSTLRLELGCVSGFPTNHTDETPASVSITQDEFNDRIKNMQKKVTPIKVQMLNAYLNRYRSAKKDLLIINMYVDTLKPQCRESFIRTMRTMDQLLKVPEAERFSSVAKIVPESYDKMTKSIVNIQSAHTNS